MVDSVDVKGIDLQAVFCRCRCRCRVVDGVPWRLGDPILDADGEAW